MFNHWPIRAHLSRRVTRLRCSVHRANHYYGHAQVLARYCGLGPERSTRIRGHVQHGWNIGHGFAPDHEFVPGIALFVWSEQTRRRAWSLGHRQAYVIGSPWAYLLRMPAEPAATEPRTGTLWYPFHGWEGQRVVGDHDRLIDTIREVEPGPVTICLYWQEFQSGRLRKRYERAGFRVICHGYRGDQWGNLDPEFLDRQLAEQRRHLRVASNRLSSAVFYGILAGCEPAVYGDPMTLEREVPIFGGPERIRREWADLHGEQVDVDTARQVAVAELGADRLVSPDEMRHLFHWPAPSEGAPATTDMFAGADR